MNSHTASSASIDSGASPRISVLMPTFNHARFIEQAVRSALLQETTCDVEILVGDDASTDGTSDVVAAMGNTSGHYLRLIRRDKNIGIGMNFVELYQASRGEFIAILEGDDYFTDRSKLQKQVDALDAHPEWSLCFHSVEYVDTAGNSLNKQFPRQNPTPYGFRELLRENQIQFCSVMVRKSCLPVLPDLLRASVNCDLPLFLLLAERGTLGYLPDVMSAYRAHGGGTWTSRLPRDRDMKTLHTLLALQDVVSSEYLPILRQGIEHAFDRQLDRIDALQQSVSWRITTPLRKALDVARLAWRRTD